MSWIWWLLGAVLVLVVGGVLYLFFVARPRNTAQVEASVKVLAREIHGRPPDTLAPATCVAISAPDKQDLPGLGVLALTPQGLFFAAAEPDRTLIVNRSTISQAEVAKSVQGPDGPVGAPLPMVVVHWQSPDGAQRQAGFTVSDPAGFVRKLQS